jgi:prolyl-tRNA synthetase
MMTHSDDKGLRLPEKVAPFQVVIETIFADKEPKVLETAKDICNKLSKDFRVKLDSTDKGIGYKSQE